MQGINGLYCVGDSCFPGQGVIAVAFSGVMCAHRVAADLGKHEDDVNHASNLSLRHCSLRFFTFHISPVSVFWLSKLGFYGFIRLKKRSFTNIGFEKRSQVLDAALLRLLGWLRTLA